jgi:hypothetical protein
MTEGILDRSLLTANGHDSPPSLRHDWHTLAHFWIDPI